MKDVCLVVPTIREKCIKDFIDRWSAIDLFNHVDLVLIEDNPNKTFNISNSVHNFCWKDIEEQLGCNSWIIPRRSDCVRSFGYWFAWKQGYKYILTLDDDCYPCTEEDGVRYDGEGFVQCHLKNLNGTTKWFNTLTNVKPRGIPFYNVGKNNNVVLSHGLWTNVLDYDAPTQLASPAKEHHAFKTEVVPNGMFFPMCGMNLMWKAEITSLMYHLMMGQQNTAEIYLPLPGEHLAKLSFDRFGDIWCGIFAKKIIDLCGKSVATGNPYIHHERASNPFANLKKEANGLEVNEKLWEYVDTWKPEVNICDYSFLYEKLGQEIYKYNEFPEHIKYFKSLGEAMQVWAKLFQKGNDK